MKKITLALGTILLIILVVTGSWVLLNPSQKIPATQEHLSIGIQPSEAAALVFVAEDQHFFAENGLDVTIRNYEPAAAGITGMLNGEVDISGASAYPVVINAFNGKNISIIGVDDRIQSVYLIGRKDRGITNISDLEGKKIGLAFGTINEFYLARFLTIHGLRQQNVTLVDVPPQHFSDSLVSGEVDAVTCAQPYADQIASSMGDAVVEWPAQSGQSVYGVFTARNDWIARNPDRVVRFLKSLDMADDYTTLHPEEAQASVRKRLNLSDTYLEVMWPRNQFGLSLDQSLVTAMEDEGRWMIANNLTNATAVPDFGKYIYTDGLESVRPGSVNIIG